MTVLPAAAPNLRAGTIEGHGADRIREWAERLQHLAFRHIPELDRFVRAGRKGLRAVAVKGHAA